MNILIIGSGGREHALVRTLRRTARQPHTLFCANGNDGIAADANLVSISPTNINALAGFAEANDINLTIVGGEAALAEGIADLFQSRNLAIAAPSRAAAQLEASKSLAKNFMQTHGIPTARSRVVASHTEAREVLASGEFGNAETPVVVKADGLAAGKGVFITDSHSEAMRAVEAVSRAGFGSSIVLEETLRGVECSLLVFTDGRDYRLMPPARDHKRIGEADTGANTGGMGAVSTQGILSFGQHEKIVKEIVEPTLEGIRREQLDFRGVLYFGLMLTPEGARVLEYNARFGDPEAQALLMLLNTDLADIFASIANQNLSEVKVEWSDEASACIVLAARGYPNEPERGAVIYGLENFQANDEIQIFHAATKREGDAWTTNGGRVLGVTAKARTLAEALEKSYAAVDKISWDGMTYRRDIGATTLENDAKRLDKRES